MKYIVVSGGVMSGIGKGVITSSIGVLLKAAGFAVTAIKIDPYINIDAGTFSPYEHGEVFVLDDGGEVDLDLGNYERFLRIRLHRNNNITTGKIFQNVINKERKGDYLGKTVQYVPHITDEIKTWIEKVAKEPIIDHDRGLQEPEICMIELGGTIGDIESMAFVEALRQFRNFVGKKNFCSVHVSLVPCSNAEQKTKPTQATVKELRHLGLGPDLIMCRSCQPLVNEVKNKIADFSDLHPQEVISVHDVPSNYCVPLILEEQNVGELLFEKLSLKKADLDLSKWKYLADMSQNILPDVTIGLVGKYTKNSDAYTSIEKALQHSAILCQRRLIVNYIEASHLEKSIEKTSADLYKKAWNLLTQSNGIIVPGGFGDRGIEGKIEAIKWARVEKKPFLGVCLGMQCALIEFARNVLHWKDANSTEFDSLTKKPIIIEMPEHNGITKGGTMRLGKKETHFVTNDSVLKKLYFEKDVIEERHRHRYEFNTLFFQDFENNGLKFVGTSEDKQRMEIVEITDHPYFVGVQFHPEYLSQAFKPSPPFLGLILSSTGNLNKYFDLLKVVNEKDCWKIFENVKSFM